MAEYEHTIVGRPDFAMLNLTLARPENLCRAFGDGCNGWAYPDEVTA